jgi:nucleoid-associated protein YgaU
MPTLPVMFRPSHILAMLLCCAPAAFAAGGGDSGPAAGDDIKIMRQMLEQQSRQIDVLAQEVARLNLLLEGRTPSAPGLAATPATEDPPAAVAPAAPAPKAVAADAAEPSKPASTGPVHIVTKGETLTVIARHYKVTVAELLKVNKIADVRKLQIGQSLVLPPGAKIPQSPTPAPQPQ